VRAGHRHRHVGGGVGTLGTAGVSGVRIVRDGIADALAGGVGGRAAAGPHRADVAVGRPVEREHVAAEPGRGRFHHVQRGRGGDGRVEGVAALAECHDARLRGQWLARRHQALRRVDRRPPRAEVVDLVSLHGRSVTSETDSSAGGDGTVPRFPDDPWPQPDRETPASEGS
jgi:hypothetical protein